MAIKILHSVYRDGHCYPGHVSGLSADMAKLERDILSGKRDAPYTVSFWRKGKLVRSSPIPLTPNGKPKIDVSLDK